VGADIHQAREHAPAHTKGEVGTETGLDFAGQRYGSMAILRLHELCVHHCRTLDRSGGAVIAGAKRRRQQGEREYGAQRARISRHGQAMDGMVHGSSPALIKLNRIVCLWDCQGPEVGSSRQIGFGQKAGAPVRDRGARAVRLNQFPRQTRTRLVPYRLYVDA